MKRSALLSSACLSLTLLAGVTFGAVANAQLIPNPPVLTNQHTDIGVGYENGEWDLHVHNEDDDIEYAPNEVLFSLGANAKTARPAGSEFDFIGTGAGAPIWLLPAQQNPELIYLGVSGEEIAPGTFDSISAPDPRLSGSGAWLTLNLSSLSGPGQFSVWTDDLAGPVPFMSTADGVGSDDALYFLEGGHTDFNWAFTAPGMYEVTFTASGVLNGQRITSDPATYYFQVQDVPEPGTVALFAGLGVSGLWMARRVRRK